MFQEKIKKEIKILWKPFVVLFAIAFLLVNWAESSWVFNYQALSGFFSDLFYNEKSALGSSQEVLGSNIDNTNIVNNITVFEYSEKENSIEIPAIGLESSLVLAQSVNDNFRKLLDKGVVHYPTSVMPGSQGQTIILGHSAPPGWPKIKHDWVFSKLNNLKEGDQVIINFNHQKIVYSVVGKVIIDKGEEIPVNPLTNSDNVLVLLSCWPPGKNIQRIAVEAKLIK